MQRHVELKHSRGYGNLGYPQTSQQPRDTQSLAAVNDYPELEAFPNKDFVLEGIKDFSKMTKVAKEYSEVMHQVAEDQNIVGQLNNCRQQTNYLQQQISSYASQLSDLHSNFWMVPKNEIQGVSGYLCPKCNSFDWRFIRDIGYDKTAQGNHRCNIAKVGQNSNDWEQILSRGLNFYLPGFKSLVTQDFTTMFEIFSSKLGSSDIAKQALGIPDRFPFYSFIESDELEWLLSFIQNPGKKMQINEKEAFLFIRKVKSSYAIFEINSESSVKLFGITFTRMF